MSNLLEFYSLPAFITGLSIAQQARFARRVGLARMKFKVMPPETTGDPGFIRVFRAHQNCSEFYPLYMTGLWLGSVYCHPVPASILGCVYMLARQSYYDGYSKAAEKRWPGFMVSVGALLGLMLIGGAGSLNAVLKAYAGINLAEKLPFHC